MKKSLLKLFMPLVGILIFSMTAYAGDINSAEQRIIDAISGTYEYDGGYYRVTDRYVSKVISYLSEDGRDMTDSQASSYIDQFYSNFATGIDSGYMVKIGDVPSAPSDTDDSSTGGGTSTGGGSSAGGGSSTGGDSSTGGGGSSTDGGTSTGGDSSTDGSSSDAGGSSNSGSQSGNNDGNVAGSDIISIDDLLSENTGLTEDGEIQDNTIGSTTDGEIEYTVFEIDDIVMYVWGIDELEVHAEAYKDSDVLGILAADDAVTVTGSATTGWAQIKYNNEVGYVSAVYLRTQAYMDSIKEDVEDEKEEIVDEVTETEEMENEDVAVDAQEQEEESVKDYSDAAPVARQVNIALIAVVIAVIFCIIMGIVIFINRNKMKNRVKNK